MPYRTPIEVVPGVTLTYFNAGHILGAAMVQLEYQEDGRSRRFVFTGDLGRRDTHLLRDSTVIRDINVLVSESTYGNRELDTYDRLIKQLHAIVARAIRLQSKVVIPAFSLGRTQRMVYCLQELFALHKVRPIPVYVDTRWPCPDRDPPRLSGRLYAPGPQPDGQGPALFRFQVRGVLATWDESRRLNYLNGPMVIIASSGSARRAGTPTICGTWSPIPITPS